MTRRHRHSSNRTPTSGRDRISSGVILGYNYQYGNGIQGKTCNGFLGYNLAMEVSGMNFN